MIFKLNVKVFLICIAIPILVGVISALLTNGNMDIYSAVLKPPLSPPGWVFPVVWSFLYSFMGISLYCAYCSNAIAKYKNIAYLVFAVQLFLNFMWSPIFFNKQWFLFAFIVLIFLLIATFVMIICFYKISKFAGILQIPYILWLVFAGYLNLAVYLLN